MRLNHLNLVLKKVKSAAGAFGPLLALALAGCLSLATPAWAVPTMPSQVYGNVTVNGVAAAAGVPVTASINGIQYASTVVDSLGRFGYPPAPFQIPADDPGTPAVEGGVDGNVVQLYAAGVAAAQFTFASGGVLNLNLAVTSGLPPASPPAQPASNPAPAPAPVSPTPAPATTTPVVISPTTAPAPVPTTASALPVVVPAPASTTGPAPTPAQTQTSVPSPKSNAGQSPVPARTPEPTPTITQQASQTAAAPEAPGVTLSYPVIGGIAGLIIVIIIILPFALKHRSK